MAERKKIIDDFKKYNKKLNETNLNGLLKNKNNIYEMEISFNCLLMFDGNKCWIEDNLGIAPYYENEIKDFNKKNRKDIGTLWAVLAEKADDWDE